MRLQEEEEKRGRGEERKRGGGENCQKIKHQHQPTLGQSREMKKDRMDFQKEEYSIDKGGGGEGKGRRGGKDKEGDEGGGEESRGGRIGQEEEDLDEGGGENDKIRSKEEIEKERKKARRVSEGKGSSLGGGG